MVHAAASEKVFSNFFNIICTSSAGDAIEEFLKNPSETTYDTMYAELTAATTTFAATFAVPSSYKLKLIDNDGNVVFDSSKGSDKNQFNFIGKVDASIMNQINIDGTSTYSPEDWWIIGPKETSPQYTKTVLSASGTTYVNSKDKSRSMHRIDSSSGAVPVVSQLYA